jgi:hypothetical protein
MTGGHVLPTPVNRLPFSYVWGLPQFPSAKLKVNIQKKSSFAYEPDSLNEATHKLANESLPNYFFYDFSKNSFNACCKVPKVFVSLSKLIPKLINCLTTSGRKPVMIVRHPIMEVA